MIAPWRRAIAARSSNSPHGQRQRRTGGEHEVLAGADLELPRAEDVGYVSTLLEDRHVPAEIGKGAAKS